MSEQLPPPPGERSDGAQPQNIATAITEVSERATLLVREEIELAKAEVTEKVAKLVKGAVVGVAAGVFFMTALVFALVGCAWLLYFYLPVGEFAYFWGFFAMAVILVILGVDPGSVMDQLGHADAGFTLRVYRHGMRRDSAARERLRAFVEGDGAHK